MTRLSSLCLMLLPLALLAGCNKSAKNDQRSATGEVLKGTISDDMLPLDKLKSQPPLLAPSERKSTAEGMADEGSSAADAASGTTEEATDETAPAPQPAPSGAQ